MLNSHKVAFPLQTFSLQSRRCLQIASATDFERADPYQRQLGKEHLLSSDINFAIQRYIRIDSSYLEIFKVLIPPVKPAQENGWHQNLRRIRSLVVKGRIEPNDDILHREWLEDYDSIVLKSWSTTAKYLPVWSNTNLVHVLSRRKPVENCLRTLWTE